MTPQDLGDNLKSALPTIASWAGRLGFGGIVAYSLAPLWNAATNADALSAMGSLAGQLIPNLLSEGITRIYDRLRSGGKTPTPKQMAQAVEDEAQSNEAFRAAMLDYVEKLLASNRHIFKEVQMTHESVVKMWGRLGKEIKKLGAAETDSAKKIEVMRDEVLAGLTRVETKVDAVKDDTSAMRPLVEEMYRRSITTPSSYTAGRDQYNAGRNQYISIVPERPSIAYIPHQPLPLTGVVGREHELTELAHHFDIANNALLHGLAGLGKSTLAALYYRGYSRDYTLRLWRNLRLDAGITGLVQAVANTAGTSFDPDQVPNEDNQAMLIVGWLQSASSPMLIVLDNLESILDNEGAVIQGGWGTLLAFASDLNNCKLLATSQVMPRNSPLHLPFPFKGLTDDKGAELLIQQGVTAPTSQLERASHLAGGHPFALMLLANLVKPPASQKLDALLSDDAIWKDDIATNILNKLWDKLSPKERALIEYVSLYTQPVSTKDIGGMVKEYRWRPYWEWEKKKSGTRPLLRPADIWNEAELAHRAVALSRRSFVNIDTEGRCSLHTIVQKYAYNELPEKLRPVYHNAAGVYFKVSHSDTSRTALPKSITEVQLLLNAFDQFCAAANFQEAHEILDSPIGEHEDQHFSLHELLDIWGQHRRLVTMSECLFRIIPGTRQGESRSRTLTRMNILINLGNDYSAVGDQVKSQQRYEEALAIARELGEDQIIAEVLVNLALASMEVGNHEAALRALQEAFTIAERLKSPELRGVVMVQFARGLIMEGDALLKSNARKEAGDRYVAAASMYELVIGLPKINKHLRATALSGAGNASVRISYFKHGIERCIEGLALAEELGDARLQAQCWSSMATACENCQRFSEAVACYIKSISLYEKDEDEELVARTKDALADIQAQSQEGWDAILRDAHDLADSPTWLPEAKDEP